MKPIQTYGGPIFGILLAIMVFGSSAFGQLIPERLYYGVGRRVPVVVVAPDDFVGELTIKLYDGASGVEIASEPAAKGR
ncbi:MAG: hypothetical protein JKY96_06055, partial [Phycisphaerales bacterium]|nr:hypothetical protein [Phycisphaerales bacterium]